MPPAIENLNQLLFFLIGALVVWGGRVLLKWITTVTEKHRKEVDKQARADHTIRELTESLYDHRTHMLRKGFSREELPQLPDYLLKK